MTQSLMTREEVQRAQKVFKKARDIDLANAYLALEERHAENKCVATLQQMALLLCEFVHREGTDPASVFSCTTLDEIQKLSVVALRLLDASLALAMSQNEPFDADVRLMVIEETARRWRQCAFSKDAREHKREVMSWEKKRKAPPRA